MKMQKRSIQNVINDLVDKDGFKTEVTITLTNQTLTKIVLTLLVSGATVLVMGHLLKSIFPNRQMTALHADIKQIKHLLKTPLK